MDWIPIPTTPPQILLSFVRVDQAPPAVTLPLSLLESTILKNVPAAKQQTLQDFFASLAKPLQDKFDDNWQAQANLPVVNGKSDRTGFKIRDAIQSAKPDAYDITVDLPMKGVLRALSGDLSTSMQDTLPPGKTGHILALNYLVPNIQANFSVKVPVFPDPNIDISFDGQLNVDIAVPDDSSVPFGIRSDFSTTNGSAIPSNLESAIEVVLDQFWSDLKSVLQSQPFKSVLEVPDQDNPEATPSLIDGLSDALKIAHDFGFTQLGVQVDTNPQFAPPGNTVEFTLTHPFDKGPEIFPLRTGDPNNANPGTLRAFPSKAHPGDRVVIQGSGFPAPRAHQIVITWADTTSGRPLQCELRFGQVSPGQSIPANPNHTTFPWTFALTNTHFALTGLTPNTTFALSLREFDVPETIATDWGAWKSFTTTTTDDVQLVLEDGTNAINEAVTISEDGSFNTTITIPTTEKPGIYNLIASYPGTPNASTPITVVSASDMINPSLMISNFERIWSNSMEIYAGQDYNFMGSHFSAGMVSLYIDSPSGDFLGQEIADGTGSFTLSGVHFIHAGDSVQDHTVIAVQNSLTASVDVTYYGPPR